MTISVVLVDDHTMLRQSLRRAIEAEGVEVVTGVNLPMLLKLATCRAGEVTAAEHQIGFVELLPVRLLGLQLLELLVLELVQLL